MVDPDVYMYVCMYVRTHMHAVTSSVDLDIEQELMPQPLATPARPPQPADLQLAPALEPASTADPGGSTQALCTRCMHFSPGHDHLDGGRARARTRTAVEGPDPRISHA